MKLLFSFLILFSFTQTFAQPAPEWFNYPGTPTAGRFDDIFFINDSTGWAVSSDGEIFKTINTGENWILKHTSPDYFRSVEFFDENVGFAGSLYGRLYKTEDGGENWEDISALIPVSFDGICGMSAADDTTIYICGVWSNPAYIFKSSDRGETWEFINMSSYAYSLVDIKFTDAEHGFVSGQSTNLDEGGIILYTENGGTDWEVKKLTGHPNDYVWKIQLLDSLNAFGAVADVAGGFETRFLKSVDAGMNWEVKTVSATYHYVEMCGFINADTGWTGSYDVMETFDGGETWHINNFGYNMNRFFRLNNNLAFSSGESIYVYRDTSYVAPIDTTEEDTTEVLIQNIFDPIHALFNITPNPSKNFITVKYTIDRNTTIDLNIFDMQGHLIHRLYHGKINADTYTQNWVHQLQAGEYIITLHSNEGLLWEKFVVVE